MNRHKLSAAFWTWMNCVAVTLSDGIVFMRPSHRIRLTEEDEDTFKVNLPPGRKSADAAVERVRIVQGAVVGPSKQLAAAFQGSQTELILRPSHFLFRPLDLPKRAGEFLEGIVRSQIDRLTPWNAADAAFGWTSPNETSKDRIALTVAATARTRVVPYVQALTTLGVKSIVVSTLPNDGTVETAPIKILQQNGANVLDVEHVRRALVATVVTAVLSMGLAVAADEIIGSHLDAEKNDVLQRLGEHRAAFRRNGFSDAPSGQFTLERRKHEMPPSVIVLEALSHILPDHTYATELRVEGDKLQVVGITRDAPSLIRLIEQSPQFTRATFFAPTTRSPNDPGEQFHIEVRIRPAFTVQK